MSMIVVVAKVSEPLQQRIVESRGQLLSRLLDGAAVEEGFDVSTDVWRERDYRDLVQAEDPEHPLSRLFAGEPFIEDYQFTYGPPSWFDPVATRALHELLVESDDGWPLEELVELMGRAVREGKGIVVGVA